MSELLQFADSPVPEGAEAAGGPVPWKLLIVDDEQDIHSVTKLTLTSLRFEGRPLHFLHAYSGEEGVELCRQNPDISMILMDVVMETADAGLVAVRRIREELGNSAVSIVMRTGYPGEAPELDVMRDYAINDYKEKTSLTAEKLFTAVYSGLRGSSAMRKLEAARAEAGEIARRLEQRNHEMQQFTYAATHDLKEPVRTIANFAQIIREDFTDRLGEEGSEFLGLIEAAAARMNDLIRDLMEYSRLGEEAQLGEIECDELVAEALGDLAGAIQAAGAEVEAAPLPRLHGYRTELRMLFQNLIANAVKFRAPDRAPHVRIDADRVDGAWRFTVADNGIGIAPEMRERVFQVFQRLNSREDYEGSGIGLAHCKKIVEMHQGQITIEDNPTGGSIFAFTIGGKLQ